MSRSLAVWPEIIILENSWNHFHELKDDILSAGCTSRKWIAGQHCNFVHARVAVGVANAVNAGHSRQISRPKLLYVHSSWKCNGVAKTA